ncbi:MAG: mechanosensitive ion channel family protein [Pyrinomonadaceae bacterium]
MSTNRTRSGRPAWLPILLIAITAFTLRLLYTFEPTLRSISENQLGVDDGILNVALQLLKLALWLAFAFAVVRVATAFVFNFLLQRRKGYEAPRLMRDLIALVAYILVFVLVFKIIFPEISLGALFTTSAVVGVILGLALQDTLGNLFAGISLHADKPFQVGDVITVGLWTGVVESITWRAVKIRTFANHIVLISNTSTAKESIEVCPRDNLNARLVFFNALYTDSPAKVIHVVREAVRETKNVSQSITPIARVMNLGESGVDYEVKYWLDDYALYNDTDALVRQRIWYAFRRAGLNFAYPTRTLHIERQPATNSNGARQKINNGIVERLAAVDIFAPLSGEELARLSANVESHVFAPGETIIRAGEKGASMFVVNRGEVEVQVSDDGQSRTIASLEEGDFFGEMGLFTGAPRTASIIAAEETEVFQIDHTAIKPLFDTNPDLVEALSHTIAERRTALDARKPEQQELEESTGLLASIKRFFGLDSD